MKGIDLARKLNQSRLEIEKARIERLRKTKLYTWEELREKLNATKS